MKKQFVLLVILVILVIAASVSFLALQDDEAPEGLRYLTIEEVLTLTQYHIDGYMATDSQTVGRDITASDQFVDLYDANNKLCAYIVPLMEDDANIGYITMPAKNSGATFYEIYIKDDIVDDLRERTAYMSSKSSDASNSKIYFFPPYSYVLATDIEGRKKYYELFNQGANELGMADVSDKFSLSRAKKYAKRKETVNEKIENILNLEDA